MFYHFSSIWSIKNHLQADGDAPTLLPGNLIKALIKATYDLHKRHRDASVLCV